MNKIDDSEKDVNPDLITGAPGSHPVGTGVGAAGAGLAATAIGAAVGGPVGAIVGAVVGSVAGGYAGKGVAEAIDPTEEDAFWRENHASQSYAEEGYGYEDFEPAYRTGYSNYVPGKTFDESETDLESSYNISKGATPIGWDKARHATRAAWDRAGQGTSSL